MSRKIINFPNENQLQKALQQRAADDAVIVSGSITITAEELLTDVAALKKWLVAKGIDRLGLLMSNGPSWLLVDLACHFSDVCLLPLPVFFSDSQLWHAMDTVGVDAVLTDDPDRLAAIEGVKSSRVEYNFLTDLVLFEFSDAVHPELPAGTSKITFTSGSTGQPRGVCLDNAGQLRVAQTLYSALAIAQPCHLSLLPLSTLLENVAGVYYALLAGGTVVLPSEADTGFSGSMLASFSTLVSSIDRHRPTSIILLPQMLVGLVAALEDGWQVPEELQFVAVGGAKVSADLIRRARALGLPVYEGYGLSECGSVVCLNYPGADRVGSVGKPLAHMNIDVVAGDVVLSGNSALGYVDEPQSWGVGEVASGDIGEFDADGYLYLHGRRKNLLISSFGRNISPEWVESEVLQQPGIAQCVVFGDARPYCIAIIAASNPAISDAEISASLESANAALPDYARVQRWLHLSEPLSVSGGLLTENGRPKRMAIAKQFASLIDALYLEAATNNLSYAQRKESA